jgi:hypothetical protein
LQKKETIQSPTKMGLENIKQRYAFISDNEVVIEETNKYFMVALPILDKNTE